MKIEIESNITDLREEIRNIRLEWERQALAVVNSWLEKVETRSKQLAPVDTGFLRENIRSLGAKISGDILSGSVSSAAEYSAFVEEGTSRMSAQPFLKPALEENIQELVNELVQLFENLFNRSEN